MVFGRVLTLPQPVLLTPPLTNNVYFPWIPLTPLLKLRYLSIILSHILKTLKNQREIEIWRSKFFLEGGLTKGVGEEVRASVFL